MGWQYPPTAIWSTSPSAQLQAECDNFETGICRTGVDSTLKYAVELEMENERQFQQVALESFAPPLRMLMAMAWFELHNNRPGLPPVQEYARLELTLVWQDLILDFKPILMHMPIHISPHSSWAEKMQALATTVSDETIRLLQQRNLLDATDYYARVGAPDYVNQM